MRIAAGERESEEWSGEREAGRSDDRQGFGGMWSGIFSIRRWTS